MVRIARMISRRWCRMMAQDRVASDLLVEVFEDGEKLLVNGHMSRANSLWKTFENSDEVLVMFQGPHTYISPTWYNHV